LEEGNIDLETTIFLNYPKESQSSITISKNV